MNTKRFLMIPAVMLLMWGWVWIPAAQAAPDPDADPPLAAQHRYVVSSAGRAAGQHLPRSRRAADGAGVFHLARPVVAPKKTVEGLVLADSYELADVAGRNHPLDALVGQQMPVSTTDPRQQDHFTVDRCDHVNGS